MRLTIVTPFTVVVETDNVAHLRAEDETGAFGILHGHADFLTVLAVSLVTWRDDAGGEHHVATRGGMLEVRSGNEISIATPEAVQDDDLQRLEGDVLARFRHEVAQEQEARTDAQRLYLAAIRQIERFLRPGTQPLMPGAVTSQSDAAIEP